MAKEPLINYFNRDFNSLLTDLINYSKNYHPDKFKYFNEASPDFMYLQLLAYIGSSLNYSIDKAFNESFRETAQSRESLIRIAQDLGFYNYHAKPASTQVTLSINVPAIPTMKGDGMTFDSRYLIGVKPGMLLQSVNSSIFECDDEINFAHEKNRTIRPNLDSNGQLIDYTIFKTAKVVAGQTQIQRFYVSSATSKPFLEILLDAEAVTEIIGVVLVKGNSFDVPTDEEFRANGESNYIEVENLAQDKVFVELDANENNGSKHGEWVNKPKRFITRRDKNNLTSIIFGSSLIDYSTWNNIVGNIDASQLVNFSLNEILNNKALGEIPQIDSTLFIKFRNGAGVSTNVITNSINEIVSKRITAPIDAPSFSVLQQVKNSLRLTSNLPAIGGTNVMSNEEIRHSVGKIFASNDRIVTYEDIKAMINNMPSKYGQPFRVSAEEIKPQLLNYNEVKDFIQNKLNDVIQIQTSIEREKAINEVSSFLENYPKQIAAINNGQQITLAQITNAFNVDENTLQHKMWLGEKCRLYILGIDENFHPTTLYKDENDIWQSPNETLKNNIRNFISEKRLIGDWIDIVDAKVINIQVEFKIIADKKNKQKVLIDCLTKLREYFNVYNWQINQPIFISNVSTILQEIEGVVNVVSLNFYNVFDTDIKTGSRYSPREFGIYPHLIPNNTSNINKYKIKDFNNVIVSNPSTFFHVKYPEKDIIGTVI